MQHIKCDREKEIKLKQQSVLVAQSVIKTQNVTQSVKPSNLNY